MAGSDSENQQRHGRREGARCWVPTGRAGGRPFLAVAWPSSAVLLLTLLFSLWLTACERCSGSPPLARLDSSVGEVQRDFSTEQQHWQVAHTGAEFRVGDAIRTGRQATAHLALDDGSALGLEDETVVRFLDRNPGVREQALDLEMGAASVEAASTGAVVRTAFGTARLEGGTRVQLSRNGSALRYEVLVGAAVVENGQGATMKVAAGQIVETSLGQAVMELVNPEPPPVEAPAEEAVPLADGEIRATITGSRVTSVPPGATSAEKVSPGATTLAAGTVLDVGGGSGVTLRRGHEQAELSSGGRYIVGADGHLVGVERGSFTVSSDSAVRIKVPGGYIVTRAGRAKVTTDGVKGTTVEAQSGSVLLSGKTNADLVAGQEGRIAPDGAVSVKGRGLSYSDIDVSPGQSLVIHDPRPPTAIGFLFGERCEAGAIHLSGRASAIPGDDHAVGEKRVSLALGPGSVSYELHCILDGAEGPLVSSGKLTVLADAGTRPVPKSAPTTFVDVNGRNYTVLYQNQLPQVTVRWSNPPEGVSSFSLKRTSPGLSRSYSSGSASYTFRSGMLGEGTHSVYFEGGGRVSRRSNITISFDNATPAASLKTPANPGVGAGGTLPIQGTALPGWAVTVDGKPVGQDADGRFSVNTSMPSDGRPTAVRLTHPQRGTHVYLRRPAGAR